MDEHEFEAHRTHLHGVAVRMLGSSTEADDAVQEAWLRISRAETGDVDNPVAWLTTVVARVCLNMLRTRRSRHEEPLDAHEPEPEESPEQQAVIADSVGLALLVVLDTLSPAERLAFVLHDLFAVSFDEIAPIVDKSPAAARQLASRARRRVQGASPDPDADAARKRRIVEAFLDASRGGDMARLLELLDPDVVLRADATVAAMGSAGLVRGAAQVAENFSGRAQAARPALLDGTAGLAWAQGGVVRVVFEFTVVGGRITGIELVGDPDYLAGLEVEFLGRSAS